MSAGIQVVTVHSTSPLRIRETSTATPVPARLVDGSSYTPVTNGLVLVVFTRGLFYILGGA